MKFAHQFRLFRIPDINDTQSIIWGGDICILTFSYHGFSTHTSDVNIAYIFRVLAVGDVDKGQSVPSCQIGDTIPDINIVYSSSSEIPATIL